MRTAIKLVKCTKDPNVFESCVAYKWDAANVKYRKGEIIKPTIAGTMLMCFDDKKHTAREIAKGMYRVCETPYDTTAFRIFRCQIPDEGCIETTTVLKPVRMIPHTQEHYSEAIFKELWNLLLNNGVSEAFYEIGYPCLLVPWVKLLRELKPIRFERACRSL